jgi:plastocyanin
MQHLDEGTIHSWLDGALSADEAARAEAHVAECPECAAVVAEARGFVAASSRILTALDNAPRGVMPVAAPGKRVNPLVWRVAATVLVVAAGTLVVVQNRGSNESLRAISENQAITSQQAASDTDLDQAVQSAGAAQTAPVDAADGAPPRATASKASPSKASPSRAPTIAVEKEAAGNTRRGITTGDNKALAEGVSVPAQTSIAADYAAPQTPAAPPAAPSRAAGVGARDLAAEPERLKVVGNPRQIGAKVTLYEVAPGDTVTFTEPMPVVLHSVVVTGAAAGARMAPQATAKSVAPPARARADAVTAAAPESRRTGEVAAAAPAVSAPALAAQREMANTLHTIRWIDSATGNTLTLTGRIPEARLQEIRIRIERERAAAAAKKNP